MQYCGRRGEMVSTRHTVRHYECTNAGDAITGRHYECTNAGDAITGRHYECTNAGDAITGRPPCAPCFLLQERACALVPIWGSLCTEEEMNF